MLKRTLAAALILAFLSGMLPVPARAEDMGTIEVLDGRLSAPALYTAIVNLSDDFMPQKSTSGMLKMQTKDINVAEVFLYEGYSGGGVKYVGDGAETVVGVNSEGDELLAHNAVYTVHHFVLSGSTPANMVFGYFDTGKSFSVKVYHEPVIASVTAEDAHGNSISLPAGASAELTDHDGGRFYHGDAATISAEPVDGYEIYVDGSLLLWNEATGKYQQEIAVTDSVAYTVIYREKEIGYAELTYTETRTDATGNTITDGTSGMVTGPTISAPYTVGETLTYKVTPVENWYVKDFQINGVSQINAESFAADRSCVVSYPVTGTDPLHVAVELAEKHLTAKDGVQDVLFNPGKSVAQQLRINGTVNGADPLEKLIFEALIASGSGENLPEPLAWDSQGIRYAYCQENTDVWHPLDLTGAEQFPNTDGATAKIKIIWAGNNRYPEVSASGTIRLVDCREPAPTREAAVDVKLDVAGVKAAVSAAAEGLGLTIDQFQTPENLKEQLDTMNAGEKKTFVFTAPFAGNADYKPGTVTVRVEVSKAPVIPAVIVLSADETKGTITVKNAGGEAVDPNRVFAAENPLTVSVVPERTTEGTYYVQSIIVTENGEELVKTEEDVSTATFHVRNSETITYEYGVAVTYDHRDLRSSIAIEENEVDGSGTASVFNAEGTAVSASCAGTLTLRIEPDEGYHVADYKVTDQDGSDVPVTGSFAATAFEGTFEIANSNAYTVTVTYGKRTLTARSSVLNYNRFYDGKVSLCAEAVKAELIENLLLSSGGSLQAQDLKVYVWCDDANEYLSIDPIENSETDNPADAAFKGEGVRLRIVWSGDSRYPETVLTDLDVTLQETRPELQVKTKTVPDDAPLLFYENQDEENRKRLKEKALSLIETENSAPIPASCLFAVDADPVFAEDFILPRDDQTHIIAVKLIWDSTAEYIGTTAIVSVPVLWHKEEDPNQGLCKLEMKSSESDLIAPGAVICIDGDSYVLDETCTAWIEPNAIQNAVFVTAYSFNQADTAYGTYPTGMHVWYAVPADSDSDGKNDTFRIERIAQLDNFFQYEGTSIRVNFSSNGIRFFSSVPIDGREKLMQGTLLTGTLAGYRMTQVGTLFKKSGTNVTLKNGVSSDVYGAKAGNNFRVFSKSGQRNLFTGMLTGLDTDAATIKADILSRPYAVLEYGGQKLTLYGAEVCRSIYYVATQNRDHFPAGSSRDEFIEGLISAGEAAS